MGRKASRNMQSRNTNKIGIQCNCWCYSQGICYDARSYDRKKISSTCFEQIIVHHQETISVHAACSTLPCNYGCLTANTIQSHCVKARHPQMHGKTLYTECCVYRNNLLIRKNYFLETCMGQFNWNNLMRKSVYFLVFPTNM